MIRAVVTLAPRIDPLDVGGVPCSGEVLLPFPTWPMTDEAPIALDEVTVRRYVPPPPPKPKPFTKKAPAGRWQIGEPPQPVDLGPALAPEAFVTWLVERLPRLGAVDPLNKAHPAFQRVVAAAREGLASPRVNPGTSTDTGWARLLHDLEHVVRRCALPVEASLAVLRTTAAARALSDDELRARIADAAAGGLCGPALRDEIVEVFAAEAEATRQTKERAEAARLREVEKIDVDLTAYGLAEFSTAEANPIALRRVFRAGGLPIGDVSIPVVFRGADGEVSVIVARVRSTGTAMLTRRERDGAACMPDEIARRLREVRAREAGPRRYSAGDFTGDARSVEGRAALVAFRAHAAGLVHALANATAHSELAAYTYSLLLSLGVAYGPAVSLTNQIDSLQEALRSFVRTSAQGRVYGSKGRAGEVAPTDRPWPSSVPKPDTIPRALLAELAKGSAWRWGECLRPPTAEEERAIRLALDPGAFERVIADAAGDATEIRSRALYDRLFAEGMSSSATPAPAERARVSAALEALGFVRGEGTDEGRRCRVYRRAASAAAPPAPEAA